MLLHEDIADESTEVRPPGGAPRLLIELSLSFRTLTDNYYGAPFSSMS